MKKIVFLSLHLNYGGIQNSIITRANLLSKKYKIEIFVVYKLLESPAFSINDNVKIIYLTSVIPNRDKFNEALKSRAPIKLIIEGLKALRILYLKKISLIKTIKKSDANVIISTRDSFNLTLGKYAKKGVVKISEEHRHHKGDDKYIKKLQRSLKNIDYFFPISQELTDFYSKILKKKRIEVLNIPYFLDVTPESVSKLNTKRIITVGRLSEEKGQLDLIEVFSEVIMEVPEAVLDIIGDGVEKEKLQKKIEDLKLINKVNLHGFQDQKYIKKYMLQSSLFAMTSFEESFGIVLIEAQSYGIPCVAFDSATGAKEIITSGKNGYLIEKRNKIRMKNLIVKLLNSKPERTRMGKLAKINSLKYSKNNIEKKWFRFFGNVLKEGK